MSPEPITPLEREVASAAAPIPGTTTVDHWDTTWVIPAQRHFRHVSAMRNQMVRGVGNWDLMIAETFLDPTLFDGLPAGTDPKDQATYNQRQRLWDINPSDAELEEFTGKIAKAIGLENLGN
jgi:hypothetical protein